MDKSVIFPFFFNEDTKMVFFDENTPKSIFKLCGGIETWSKQAPAPSLPPTVNWLSRIKGYQRLSIKVEVVYKLFLILHHHPKLFIA